jgi:hypothetical protein
MGLHIALGWPWFDHRVTQGSVVYIAAESGDWVRNRIAAFKQYWRAKGRTVSDETSFHLIPVPLDLLPTGPDSDLEALTETIREVCPNPLLIVIDTVTTAAPGREQNESATMSQFVVNMQRLRLANRRAACLRHSPSTEKRPDMMRGPNVLPYGIDTIMKVSRTEGTAISTMEVLKQRDGESGQKIHFQLEKSRSGNNKLVISCVVFESAEAAPERQEGPN